MDGACAAVWTGGIGILKAAAADMTFAGPFIRLIRKHLSSVENPMPGLPMNSDSKMPDVRALPYPYKAGIAISNDAEFMSREFFEGLMAFLNGTGTTPLGGGLGLEVTSSTFFYSAHPYSFSYFQGAGVDGERTPFAPRMEDYLKSGWIDTLHSYGDFDGVGGFVRAHAERTFDALGRMGVVLPIFTNHGDRANIQNIGGDADYHQGDLPDTASYHADLLSDHGVRYVWTDTAIIGESPIPRTGWRTLVPWRTSSPARPFMAALQLRDGHNMQRFMRFRGTGGNAPNLSSLAYQLDRVNLPELYRRNGITVLYQHLGVLCRSGGKCVAATLAAMLERPEVYLAPWYRLAHEVREGRLWLAGLARLLRYIEMIGDLGVEMDGRGGINLHSAIKVADPEEYFQGLTLYVDPADTPTVTYNGRQLSVVHNGPDETGRYSISIPLRRLANIWH